MNPWTHLNLANDPESFQFAIVTDRTGNHRPGVFPDAVRKLNLLQPEFVMSVGDLIEGYTEDREVLDGEWEEFVGFVETLEMPFFFLPGNHDISNQVMADVWQERFGLSYYSFVYRDVLFVCLNTESPESTRLSEPQLQWLDGVLAAHTDVRWTLVFLHKPLWAYVDSETHELRDTGWARAEEALRGRKHTVFAGHWHTYAKYIRNDSRYFILATTGGGSSLLGPRHGSFDHVVWVTMTDEGPRIANLMLDGIWDEDVLTEDLARMIGPLLSGRAVTVTPIMGDSDQFRRGATEIRVTNDADVPLVVRGRFEERDILKVSPGSFDVVIPPNSVEQIPLTVTADERRSVDDLPPMTLQWQAEYRSTEEEVPVIEGNSALVVSRIFELRRRSKPVVVDGDLSDWDELPFDIQTPSEIDEAADSWTGPEDCSWRFAVEYDDDKLYVAVDVTDERKVYLRSNPWTQDGIEVRVDGRPDPMRSRNRDRGEERVIVGISPDEALEHMLLYEELDSLGVEAIGIPSAKGHVYEMSIPISYVEQRQGTDWKRVRINIVVDDLDDPTGPMAQLWWQPNWRNPTNLEGSGTFERK